MGLDHIIPWLLDHGAVINDASHGVNPCAGTAHRYESIMLGPIAWTPLEMAVCRRQLSSVALLLERATGTQDRAAVNGPQDQGLHIAVHHGHDEVVNLLLRSGRYDVNTLSTHNELLVTLRGPGYRSHLPTLRALLQAKPDLTIESYCSNASIFGVRLGTPAMSALPLHNTIAAGEYEAALLLLEAGADATAPCRGFYPLHCAFFSDEEVENEEDPSRLRLLKALLARGADPNSRSSLAHLNGVTPLMLAAWYAPYPETINLLLKHGADVNAVDEGGQNALQWSVRPYLIWSYSSQSLQSLPARTDHDLNTSIQMARVVRLLLDNGCSVGQKNLRGQCALQHFAQHVEEAKAFDDVLAHHPEECAAAGCLDESLRLSLNAGCFDTAYALSDAGVSPPSEKAMLEVTDNLLEEEGMAEDTTYMSGHYVLDDCKAFAEHVGIFGKDLQDYIADFEKAHPRLEDDEEDHP